MNERLVPISITKGSIRKISLTFNDTEKRLEVYATMSLKTDQGHHITEVSFESHGWTASKTIEVPTFMIPYASEIRRAIEGECVRKMNHGRLALPEPKEEDLST